MQGFFQRFISLYRPIINELNNLLGEYDLSYSLWQVIYFIKNNGPSALVDISNYYNVEKPTITRRVQRLEEMNIVQVVPGKDKREKLVHITSTGEEIYQSCREKITELENTVMEGIPLDAQVTVFETLPQIKKNIMEGK